MDDRLDKITLDPDPAAGKAGATRVPLRDYLNPQKTLRDEFAMAALTGILAAPDITNIGGAHIVEQSYIYADHMLKERLKEKS